MVPCIKVTVKGKVDISVLSLPLMYNDCLLFIFNNSMKLQAFLLHLLIFSTHLSHFDPDVSLDRMHFAFAVAHGAQAAPHLAVGSFGRSLELLVVGSETSAPASILCQ